MDQDRNDDCIISTESAPLQIGGGGDDPSDYIIDDDEVSEESRALMKQQADETYVDDPILGICAECWWCTPDADDPYCSLREDWVSPYGRCVELNPLA